MMGESTLSSGLASAIGGGGRWQPLLAALLAGTLLGVVASELARATFPRPAAEPAARAAAVEWPEREIPAEWRWRGPDYRIERMFPRARAATRR